MTIVLCWKSEQVHNMSSQCLSVVTEMKVECVFLLSAAGGTESSLFTAEMFAMYQKCVL